MNPSNAHKLRKATLKKRKANIVLTVGEPSRVHAIAISKPDVVMFDTLKVAPPVILRHSQVLKASSSFIPHSITFKGVLDDQVLGFEVCIFDNWKVMKGIFKNFIHLVDIDRVVREGNQHHQRDVVLTIIRVSFFLSFELGFHHLVSHH